MPGPRASVVWDERFLEYDFGPDHPFTQKSRALAAHLLGGLAPPADASPLRWVVEVLPASRGLLETFHRRTYVDWVAAVDAAETPPLLDAGDTPGFPGCFAAASRIVEGASRALDLAIEHSAPAFHPAGGLHHAHPARASGFCIFNDVAIAVDRATREFSRVAYVDIDAHHGDGVMYGFYESGRVLDIDFHQDGRTLFPGTGFPSEAGRGDGAGLKVNVPLPPRTGDEALLPLFRAIVPPLIRSFRPDMIILQHGVDGHVGDGLAQLQYTPEAYAEIDRTILSLAHEVADDRLLVTGGGGYRAASVSRVLARTGAILAALAPPADTDPLPEPWRHEYQMRMGEPAPTTWAEPVVPIPSAWRPEEGSKVIRQLEHALGQRFRAMD
jgi:acetoin utilization protein AcuC